MGSIPLDKLYDFISSLWVVWLSLMFVFILFKVLRPSSKTRLESYGRIPMEDDQPLPSQPATQQVE